MSTGSLVLETLSNSGCPHWIYSFHQSYTKFSYPVVYLWGILVIYFKIKPERRIHFSTQIVFSTVNAVFMQTQRVASMRAFLFLGRRRVCWGENHLIQHIFKQTGKQTLIQGDCLTNKLWVPPLNARFKFC